MRATLVTLCVLACACALPLAESNWRPVVLLHGAQASAGAMSHAEKWIKEDFPGIYVLNVEIGNGKPDSLQMEINRQVAEFAKTVQADERLKDGFNFIGHSQGGLIGRAFIERYNTPPVYNYISWASPHAGVFGTPSLNVLCPNYLCPEVDMLIDFFVNGRVTGDWVQEQLSVATYWKDPLSYSKYLKANHFLADINNEHEQKNATYRENLMSLNTMGLCYSTVDAVALPNTSPVFEFYPVGHMKKVLPMNETDLYKEDWIGLRDLDSRGRLVTWSTDCAHEDIPRDVCRESYEQHTKPLLANTLGA